MEGQWAQEALQGKKKSNIFLTDLDRRHVVSGVQSDTSQKKNTSRENEDDLNSYKCAYGFREDSRDSQNHCANELLVEKTN